MTCSKIYQILPEHFYHQIIHPSTLLCCKKQKAMMEINKQRFKLDSLQERKKENEIVLKNWSSFEYEFVPRKDKKIVLF